MVEVGSGSCCVIPGGLSRALARWRPWGRLRRVRDARGLCGWRLSGQPTGADAPPAAVGASAPTSWTMKRGGRPASRRWLQLCRRAPRGLSHGRHHRSAGCRSERRCRGSAATADVVAHPTSSPRTRCRCAPRITSSSAISSRAAQSSTLPLRRNHSCRVWPEILQCALDALEGPGRRSRSRRTCRAGRPTMILQKGGVVAPDARACRRTMPMRDS